MRHARIAWTIIVLATLFHVGGCAGTIGRYTVRTPNHGKSADQLDAHSSKPAMTGAVIDHRFYVEILEPAATLSVWVIDSSNEKMYDNEQGLWFATPHQKPRIVQPVHSTVFILHGFRHNKNDWAYLMWARFLAEHGYRTVLVDLRGHGASTGDWSTFGPQEARDLKHVVDELERRQLLVGKLGVFGGSYGGATAIHFAGIDSRVKCVVTVSAFSTMRGVLPTFTQAQLGWLSGLMEMWSYDRIVDASGQAGEFDPELSDARIAIAKTTAHILLMHSKADQHVPVQNARDLAYTGGGRVRLILFEDADHFSFGVNDAHDVRQATIQWFDEHLK